MDKLGSQWELYQIDPDLPIEFSGKSQIVLWEEEKGSMYRLAESVKHLNHKAQQWRSGKSNWEKKGIAVTLMGKIIGTLYNGNVYSQSTGVIIPKKKNFLHPYGATYIRRYLKKSKGN